MNLAFRNKKKNPTDTGNNYTCVYCRGKYKFKDNYFKNVSVLLGQILH